MFNSSQNELIKLLREILMHQNSLEFELAERIWNSSTDKKTKEKLFRTMKWHVTKVMHEPTWRYMK